MSIELLKERKVKAIQNLLNRSKGSKFSEGLSEAFKFDGKPYKVDLPPLEQKEVERLEPLITVRDSIKPIMTEEKEDVEMSERVETISESAEDNMEDVTELLDAIHIFSLSSSQIPVQQNAITLSDLVKLSTPKLKTVTGSVDFKAWSDEIIADLLKEISETEDIPSVNAALLTRSVLLNKICELNSSAPRLLMNSIQLLAKKDGKAVVDGLVIPLLFYSNLGRPQTEVINKTITECLNSTQRSLLLQVILSEGEIYFSNIDHPFPSSERKYLKPWSDSVFQIMSSILSTQPLITLNKISLFELLQPIQAIVQANPKDKSSMQFLLLLTSKYPQALVEFSAIENVESICKISTMFLKRSVLGQISSIRKNNASLQK